MITERARCASRTRSKKCFRWHLKVGKECVLDMKMFGRAFEVDALACPKLLLKRICSGFDKVALCDPVFWVRHELASVCAVFSAVILIQYMPCPSTNRLLLQVDNSSSHAIWQLCSGVSTSNAFTFSVSVNAIAHEPLHLAWWKFCEQWTCTSATSRSLLNIKVIGQRSRLHGFLFAFSCAWYRSNQLAWIHKMLHRHHRPLIPHRSLLNMQTLGLKSLAWKMWCLSLIQHCATRG